MELPDFDAIAWNGREVNICFDSDVVDKKSVRGAMRPLAGILTRRTARVRNVVLGSGARGEKRGLRLELARPDALQAAVWATALAADTVAVTAVLRFIEQRAKLLGPGSRSPAGRRNGTAHHGGRTRPGDEHITREVPADSGLARRVAGH